ncbi:hypothetical protein EXIGLDRAFT_321468 [Exidia glandulosa HHB12029]|uniref:Uncharacterized protein n=1 Tax=Exidia glandulosa HHB12029 TaxID=1314781 RepID=A0A165LR68_EXIGL|nr:hypothetical protein EXIGLDRAFT_321468 [Exidia glandulosa HHB12029]
MLPVGLPKFSFLGTPRRAPRPPEQQNEQSGSAMSPTRGPMQVMSNWISTRASFGEPPLPLPRPPPPPVREIDVEQQQQISVRAPTPGDPVVRADPYNLNTPTPVGTPEFTQWRTLPQQPRQAYPQPQQVQRNLTPVQRNVTPEDERPTSTNALALLGPRTFDPSPTTAADFRASRYGFPPPTPPPQGPLPLPPVQLRPLSPNAEQVRDSGVDLQTESPSENAGTGLGLRTRPVSSTFGHVTTSASTSKSAASELERADRASRRSSAPAIRISAPSIPTPTRPLSNPGTVLMEQSIEALLREQDELDAAYPTPSPNPRRSVVSVMSATTVFTGEGAMSTESNSNSQERSIMTARESSRSDFSLSKFPAPPASSFKRAVAPLKSRFSTESSDDIGVRAGPSSMRMSYSTSGGRLRPPTLTVETDMGRIRRGGSSGGTQWDVTSFIGGMSSPSSPSNVLLIFES